MKKYSSFQLFTIFFLLTQYGFSQVDVVYNDLVWSDEFTTNGPVNDNNWFHQTQLPDGGSWFNGEAQHYTNQTSNSFVADGFLNIAAIKENYTDQGITKAYTSARLNSKFAFKYGRVDVRAKLPIESGTWPAIWMLGKNVNENGGYFDANFGTADWPACGEIDIMEHGIFLSQPVNYIQSTLHTPSSYGNSVNNGGTLAADLQNSYHVYSLNWSPFQISFLLDGVVFYTYDPAVKNANNWPFDKEQFILLDVAMGGVAGAIPSNFNQATMQIDYVRVFQNTQLDTENPTDFTVTVGAVTSASVELLLNANDNSGTVLYNVEYGSNSTASTAVSGVQKSIIIPNLSPNTNYTFTATATDLAGNAAANPILVNATTLANLSCSGTDTLAQQGSFNIGYDYTFETIGTDVKITFELLDTNHVGVIAYLWNENPFTEVPMTNVYGNIFTKTITGQSIGSTINFAVKFAYAGGLSVTRYVSYVVGTNCSLSAATSATLENFSFENPAKRSVHIHSEIAIDKVEIYNMLGVLVVVSKENANEVSVENLSKGVYLLAVYSGSEKSVKKLVVN